MTGDEFGNYIMAFCFGALAAFLIVLAMGHTEDKHIEAGAEIKLGESIYTCKVIKEHVWKEIK